VLVTEAKRVAIYARVSTTEQDPEVQLLQLHEEVTRRGWTLAGEYVDHGVSGAKDRRPKLDAMLEDVRLRRVDIVLVWALDRLGRSLRHLVGLVEDLGAIGVDLICHTQPIDTTTPTGRFTFAILGAVAEFEREMIRGRVRAGLAKARAKGVKLGRRPKDIDVTQVRARIAAGESRRAVARDLGISHATVGRALAAVPS
jgi:DNA invertase Pin-like site-specific DNA recombinase